MSVLNDREELWVRNAEESVNKDDRQLAALVRKLDLRVDELTTRLEEEGVYPEPTDAAKCKCTYADKGWRWTYGCPIHASTSTPEGETPNYPCAKCGGPGSDEAGDLCLSCVGGE